MYARPREGAKLRFPRGVRSRLLAILLSLTALPVLLIGGLAYRDATKIIESRVTAQLETLVDVKKERIMAWFEHRTSDARLLADDVLNEERFSEILNPRIKAERRAEVSAFLTNTLRGSQRPRTGYRELALIDTRGRIVLSTLPAHIGMSLAANPVVSGTFASPTGAFIRDMYLGGDGQPEMAFGHVLRAVDLATKQRRPQITGAVIIWARMADGLYPDVRSGQGMSRTGESLLLRTDGPETVFLSPLRFRDQAPPTFRLPTGSPHGQIETISLGRDGVTQGLDYRGVRVLAAYRVIPERNWELVTKLDVAEAFAPVFDLSRQWMLITVLVLLAAVGTAVVLAGTFTRPLAQLAAATQAVAAGDFEVDVPVGRADELGDLAGSFRTMIAAVRARDTELRAHAEEMTRLLDRSNRAEAERRRAEQEVRTLNLQLEQRVSERTTQLVKVNEELKHAREAADQANRAKSEFLSRMSHELRTPLNAILGFGQLMEMDSLSAKQHEHVEDILKGGRHLLDLINEVLEIARIEAGRFSISPEPISVQEVVQESLTLIAPISAQEGVRLEDGTAGVPDRFVWADRQRLKQVLLNLLAVKYNRKGGLVTLAYEVIPEGRLRIKVSDTGPGIAPERLERLFIPFERLGAEQTAIEGTGLGLALSKRLVEVMGGTLGVDSIVDWGSTFWVELALAEGPVQRESKVMPGSPEVDAPQSVGTVLYIEDNLSNLKLIQDLLSLRPEIRLIPAMQGRLGLDLARQHRPHVILLDLHLPDMPGDEVLVRLHGDPETRHIPVVVISADATPGRVDRLLAAGARAYLTKPLDVKKLLALLDEALKREEPSEGGPHA